MADSELTPEELAELRTQAVQLIAAAMDVPAEALTMSDADFHAWLWTTPEGRRLLDADGE